jgi:CheY-like chemotaxis protein
MSSHRARPPGALPTHRTERIFGPVRAGTSSGCRQTGEALDARATYDRLVGNDALDAQTSARLLKRALALVGSRERLTAILAVQEADLATWIAGKSFPPSAIFEKLLELILDADAAKRPPAAQANQEARKRLLVADGSQGCEVIAAILGDEFALVAVHTLTDALDLVQSSAATTQRIDAIVCGQHFEGSQMLRFLQCVKEYRPTSSIPFIGCRSLPTHLGTGALAAMREACEALGAVAYIDLAERKKSAGEERAAIEFRDAVRAAVRMPATPEKLRVLVVDDNPDAAHTLAALLRIAGHETQKAASGAEALALAKEIRPHAAVLDIGMQGMSGHALAQALRATDWGRDMLLIAFTGRDDEQELARTREAGFDHHFTKPATLEQLLEALKKGRNG